MAGACLSVYPTKGEEVQWRHFTIADPLPGEGWGTAGTPLADFDGDGDLDVALSRRPAHGFYWYERKSDSEWIQHVLSEAPELPQSLGATAVDVDRDGWTDLVFSQLWFRNPGTLRTAPDSAWSVHRYEGGGHDILAADVDGDGAREVVVFDGHDLRWFGGKDLGTIHPVASGIDHHGGLTPHGAGDIDGDGDVDLVIAGTWFENPGHGNGTWLPHAWPYEPIPNASYGVSIRSWVTDLDQDGQQDILYSDCDTGSGHVCWVRNEGNGKQWSRRPLPDPPTHPGDPPGTGSWHSLGVADFDLDGDPDIFSGEQEDPDQYMVAQGKLPMKPAGLKERGVIWVNSGTKPPEFTPQVIQLDNPGWHDASIGDVDGDGDPDIVSKVWNKDGPAYHADFWRNDLSVDRFFRSDGGAPGGTGHLPERLDPTQNLRWRIPMDSGHSTPILHSSRIFLTTFRAADRELGVEALDARNGEVLWRHGIHVDALEEVHPQMGNPATATPACDGKHVYVFFGSYGLLCYDLDGRLQWERRMGPFQDEYGAGSSPILIDDKIILVEDHDRDNFLIALARTDGHTLWKQDRPKAVRSYATPVVWSHGSQREILVAGALELVSYDPDTGGERWRVGGLARIVIPQPVVDGAMVYMASWSPGGDTGSRLNLDLWPEALRKWDHDQDGRLGRTEIDNAAVLDRFYRMDLNQDGRLDPQEWERHREVFRRAQNVVLALRPEGLGDLTERALVWKYPRGAPYVSTPLIHQGVLWIVRDGGIVTMLDAVTGERIAEERLPGIGNYAASPVVGDGKIYFASVSGTVSVVAAQREWRVLSSHPFRERILATPVIEGDRILVRTEQALYAFGEGRDGR